MINPSISEDVWFRLMQPKLLQMVNTDFGRDLLCIDKRPNPIVFFSKNCVRYYLGRHDRKHYFLSDYRVGAKWANVIRTRWNQFESYSRYFLNSDSALLASPTTRFARSLVCTTTTVYPDPSPHTTTMDGYVYRNVNESWASLHDAVNASSKADDTTEAQAAYIADSSNNTTMKELIRSVFLFDTSTIPDTDQISSGVFSLFITGKGNALYAAPELDVVASSPVSNTSLATTDYPFFDATPFGSMTYAGCTTSAYNDITLNASGLAAISQTDVTKFGTRLDKDTDNVDPGIVSDGAGTASYFTSYQADQAGTTSDPKLTVTHAAATLHRELSTLFTA